MPKAANLDARNTDLSILHPQMRTAVQAVLADLEAQGIPLFVFEAFRSPQRQAFLYAKGRTSPGKVVTYAPAWSSYHQYGLAVDFVFGGPGKWTWDEPKKGMWKSLHVIGEKHGLMRLKFETPHLQVAGLSSNALREGVYPEGGDAAWAENLRAVIKGWKGKPSAPPPPKADGSVIAKMAAEFVLPQRTGPAKLKDGIIEIAATSKIARYEWKNRGVAPLGYTKGMALAYARVYRKLRDGDATAKFMAAKAGNADTDALGHYAAKFAALGLDNGKNGADTLRHLFVLLLGLGMRESSGRYCEGRDMAAHNTQAERAEAGLFQSSYNLIGDNQVLKGIHTAYAAGADGLGVEFSEGVSCKAKDWKTWGTGKGGAFQKLSKESPCFAVELAAAGLRCARGHWGPIGKRAAEVKTEADEMFAAVQKLVDSA